MAPDRVDGASAVVARARWVPAAGNLSYDRVMEVQSFQHLRDAPLHRLTPDEWPAWYAGVTAFLEDGDAAIRAAALERLVMGVFRAEPMSLRSPAREAAARDRTLWFLDRLDAVQAAHPELMPAFLGHLRWHGDDEPFPDILVPWLRRLRERRLPAVPDDRIEAALVLIGGLDWPDRTELPALFDHASDHVRSCAANRFGRQGLAYAVGDEDVMDPAVIDKLTAKELVRPGLAGPFWSGCGFFGDYASFGRDPVDWMLGIIERRSGPEPIDMDFNGIDFHIHELAAGDMAAIARLARTGRADLALMAATEIHDAVPAVLPVLRDLGSHENAAMAWAAQAHLARFYGEAHPAAPADRLRRIADWRPGVDAVVMRVGEAPRQSDLTVFFPSARATFDETEAWSIIDAAMPPALRGEVERHFLADFDEEPGPARVGKDQLWSYRNGLVTLSGDPDGQGWRRIEVSGKRLGDRWQPFAWTVGIG